MSSEKQTVNLLGESRAVLLGCEEEKDKQRESEISIESLYKLNNTKHGHICR